MKRSLFFMIFALATKTWAAGIVGTWEGTTCQSYNDHISWGTYNYKFMEDGKVETFLQYYDDDQCAKAKLSAAPQANGNYTVTTQPLDGGDGEYHVRLFYSHWNGIKIYKMVIKGDIMTILDYKGDSKGSYKRLL